MKVELIKNKSVNKSKYKQNELVFYFDEDMFNDADYNVKNKKGQALIEQCKKEIDKHLQDLQPLDNAGIKFDSVLCFNFENMPDAKIVDNHGINTSAIFSILVEITAYAVEQVLDTTLERKGRKWFRKRGAPKSHVEAEKCGEGIKTAIKNNGCWGCWGIGVHTGDDAEDNPTSCPLF